MQRWVAAFEADEAHVDREVEGEGEEGDDDEVDKADGDGGGRGRREERAEVEDREADSGGYGLRDSRERRAGVGCVCHEPAGPHLTEGGLDGCGNLVKEGYYVGVNCGFVAGFDVDELTGSEGVVGVVSSQDGGLEKGGRVGVDDYGAPGVFVEDSLADCYGIIVVERWGMGRESKVRGRAFGEFVCVLGDDRSD